MKVGQDTITLTIAGAEVTIGAAALAALAVLVWWLT